MVKIKIFVLLCLISVVGCSPYESMVNFQESPELPLTSRQVINFEPIKLQPSDILSIEVSSADKEAVAVFNEFQTSGYLIDQHGSIEFPLIGNIELGGKTLEQAREVIREKIDKYFKVAPTVTLSLVNFSIVVNGEVGNPGKITVANDRLSIIEAISQAGDFTNYSNRDSVLVIREQEGTRSFGYVNFNSSEIFNSPYFYLRQNDVIYIKPEKRILGNIRTRQDKLLPYISVGISVILLSFTIARNR